MLPWITLLLMAMATSVFASSYGEETKSDVLPTKTLINCLATTQVDPSSCQTRKGVKSSETWENQFFIVQNDKEGGLSPIEPIAKTKNTTKKDLANIPYQTRALVFAWMVYQNRPDRRYKKNTPDDFFAEYLGLDPTANFQLAFKSDRGNTSTRFSYGSGEKDTFDFHYGWYENKDNLVVFFDGCKAKTKCVTSHLSQSAIPKPLREQYGPAYANTYEFWKTLEVKIVNIVLAKRKANPEVKIWFTGFSIGGALAQLGAFFLKNKYDVDVIEIHSFGSPKAWRDYYIKRKEVPFKHYRWTSQGDISDHFPIGPLHNVKARKILNKEIVYDGKTIFKINFSGVFSNIDRKYVLDEDGIGATNDKHALGRFIDNLVRIQQEN